MERQRETERDREREREREGKLVEISVTPKENLDEKITTSVRY